MAVSLHGNNGFTTTNGTAAAPSLAAPDNDTGLYFGTNLIHASTSGTERLRIDANGRLTLYNSEGIKLSAKTSNMYQLDGALSYYGTTNAVYLNGAGASGWLRLQATGSANDRTAINIFGQNVTSNGDTIQFKTNSTERLYISATGNIGINRTDPDQRLNVNGNIEVNAYDNANGGNGYYTSKGLIIGNAYDAGKASSVTDDRNAIIWQERGLDLDFATNNTFRMKIKHDGKIGINATSPNTELEIQSATDPKIRLQSQESGNKRLDLWIDGGEAIGYIAADQSASQLAFRTTGTERLRINSVGNVSIGNNPTVHADTLFHVEDTGELNAYFVGNTSTSGARLILHNKNTAANAYTGVLGADSGGQTTAQILFYSADHANNEGYLTLGTRPSGGLPTERFRITSAGKIKLGSGGDVVGSANVEIRYDNPVLLVRDTAESSADNDAKIGFGNNTHYPVAYMSHVWDGTNGALTFHTRLSGNESEKLRISSVGYVGINETNPTTHLHVEQDNAHSSTYYLNTDAALLIQNKNSTSTSKTVLKLEAPNSSPAECAIVYGAGSSTLIFADRQHERLRINTNGHVEITNGNLEFANGSGIDFSNVPDGSRSISTDGNKFDDYEEGFWSPQVLDGNGSNYTISFNSSVTRYVKIGRVVYCWYNITRTETGSKTGTLRFYASTLPFSITENFHGGEYWVDHGGPTSGQGDIVGGVHYGTSNGVYWVMPTREIGTTSTAPNRYIDHGNWTNGRPIYGMFYYTTAT